MSDRSGPAVDTLLECRDVKKSYGVVQALRGASLAVGKGSVHGIVGHNGAGKSTLVKIIAGLVDPDDGSVVFDGDQIADSGRREAISHGIWSVPQELTVLPDLTVADNVSVGNEPHRGPFVRGREMRAKANRTLATLGLEISPNARLDELSASQQRMVMIAMAVSRDCRLLILDEPTASLGPDESEPLLQLITRLADSGITALYISHRLDEVERLCDAVTVMRDGMTLETLGRGRFDAKSLVSKMVDELPEPIPRAPHLKTDRIGVSLVGVRGGSLRGVDIEARAGSITGLSGLVGSGADEVLEVVAGATRITAGVVSVEGEPLNLKTPADALKAGIGYVPGTRAEAAMADLTIRENVLASSMNLVSGFAGSLFGRSERRRAKQEVAPFGLEDRTENPLSDLSGGNQQKVLFGRLFAADVKVIVINDPSAGVDVKARADLHALLRAAADQGRTVLVRCSEPEELVDLADEVYTLAGGRVTARFEGDDITLSKLFEASASSGRGNGTAPSGPAPVT